MPQRRSNESLEQRMRAARAGVELRMELRGEKPGMMLQFHDFHEPSIGGHPAED
jgi:hypothetical protein